MKAFSFLFYKFFIMLPTRKSQHHKFLQFPYSLFFLTFSLISFCSHGLKRDTAAGRYIFIYFRYTANRHATTLGQQEFISYYFLLVIYYHILYVILYIMLIQIFSPFFVFFFCFFSSFFFFASSFYSNSCSQHSDIHTYSCICNTASLFFCFSYSYILFSQHPEARQSFFTMMKGSASIEFTASYLPVSFQFLLE